MKLIKWEHLIKISKKFNKIIISGCQRSGTTYAAEALSQELRYNHYDERTFKNVDMDLFNKIIKLKEKQVIQAPAILHKLKDYQYICLIVIMVRQKEDVVKSMLNHNWFEKYGLKEWKKFSKEECLGPSALYDIKINFAQKLRNVCLNYNELKKTKNFVENRLGWSIKQTTI